jgi:hypothetical protein
MIFIDLKEATTQQSSNLVRDASFCIIRGFNRAEHQRGK